MKRDLDQLMLCNWDYLRAFFALAKRQSIEDALPDVKIARKTMNRHVESLANNVGHDLLVSRGRGKKPQQMTEEGAMLFSWMENVLASFSSEFFYSAV